MSIAGKEAYRRWLKNSPEWETVRQIALVLAGCTCKGCGKYDVKNDAHHIWYPKTWNKTNPHHLRILCRKCHEKVHKLSEPKEYKNRYEAEEGFKLAIWKIRRELGLPKEQRQSIYKAGLESRQIYLNNERAKWNNPAPVKVKLPRRIKPRQTKKEAAFFTAERRKQREERRNRAVKNAEMINSVMREFGFA